MEAFTELGCTRLSEYIRQLKFTHKVKAEVLTRVNRYGETCHFKKYSFEEVKQ
jgi:hypothetical protein